MEGILAVHNKIIKQNKTDQKHLKTLITKLS